mmetsp:Transcript_14323/g.36591  ORF Transcript_14323/g.36591 Transcript_14323/m.36591 type:complete len:285 (-) Transcript_14323:76-930(-)
MSGDVPKEFRCASTGKALYMPVVTLQGVAYSYVALFEMLASPKGGVAKCKVTQEPIYFLPAVCLPLHHFLMAEYKQTMKGRARQDEADMQEKFGKQLPAVSDAPDDDTDEGHEEALECVVSHELVYEPCVLSSGSLVSAYCIPEGGFKKDPDRLVACALHNQAPKKCVALETMIKTQFPQLYSQRAMDLAKQGIQPNGKHAKGTCKEFDPSDYVFWGLGCDGCGIWPVRGSAWEDADCPESTGYHLCGACYEVGYHRRSITGRLKQTHLPKHKMVEMVRSEFGF